MKIMHISDLHIGKTISDINLIEDQKYVLNQVLNEIDKNNIEVLIIAGDIYDKSNPSQESLNLFNDFINNLSHKNIVTFIISGNHDSSIRLEYLSSFLRTSNIFISKQFSLNIEKITLQDEFGNINFYLLPFFKISTFKNLSNENIKNYDEAIKYLFENKINKNERNILIAHQYVNGAITSDSEEVIIGGLDGISHVVFKDFDYVALGHLHSPQYVKKENIRYCGTLIKYSLSEVNQKKSITTIDIKHKNDIKIELIPVKYLHDLKEIKGRYDELINFKYTEDYVSIILLDDEYIVDARINLLTVFPNMIKFQIINNKSNINYEINNLQDFNKLSPLELFSEFYKVQNNGIEPSEESLKIINKILEEE